MDWDLNVLQDREKLSYLYKHTLQRLLTQLKLKPVGNLHSSSAFHRQVAKPVPLPRCKHEICQMVTYKNDKRLFKHQAK